MPRWIYESPDKGKTVYRRDADDPNAERELYRGETETTLTIEDLVIPIDLENGGSHAETSSSV